VEAALSLGLKPFQALRLVIVPQALRIIIPPMTSQYLSLTKSSSLGVVVGYPELMRVTTAVISETGRAIECIAIMMSIYLLLSLLTSALMSYLDRRTAFVER
jgi:general L-amino acid transport system permease protein